MKLLKKITIGIVSMLTMMLVAISVEATSSTDIVVGYSPEEASLRDFSLQVEIEGKGAVYDNGIRVQNQTVYTVHCEEKKSFQLEAETGYELQRVDYDGQEITNEVNEGRITVEAKAHDTKLKITFGSKEGTIETGDGTRRMVWVSTMIGIALWMMVQGRRKKEDKNEAV